MVAYSKPTNSNHSKGEDAGQYRESGLSGLGVKLAHLKQEGYVNVAATSLNLPL